MKLAIDDRIVDYINLIQYKRIKGIDGIRTNAGCVALARDMEENNYLGDCVPLSTLKRMFVTNVSNRVTRPRLRNLDALAHYCGFSNYQQLWEAAHATEEKIAAALDPYNEPEGRWIYKLVHYRYFELFDYLEDDVTPDYSRLTVTADNDAYFNSLADALEPIIQNAAVKDNETYCYKVMRYPMGKASDVYALWLFAPDAELLEFTSFITEPHYDESKPPRFKEGDSVEVMQKGSSTVKRGIIAKWPRSGLVCEHNLYFVVFDPSTDDHTAAFAWNTMASRYTLPESLTAEVKAWLKRMVPFTGEKSTGPFTLYQDENGLWGIMDSTGQKLGSKLKHLAENLYLSKIDDFWIFDSQSGFHLIGDREEVSAALNPAYLREYNKYLFYKYKYDVPEWPEDCVPLLEQCSGLPEWLRDCLIESCDPDFERDEERKAQMIKNNRILIDIEASTDPIYDVLMSPDVSEQVKATLWNAKLKLDYELHINRKDRFR